MSTSTSTAKPKAGASVLIKSGMFLTYPQFQTVADGTPDLENIKSCLLAQLSHYIREGRIREFDRGVVARERHEDGNWHLHVFLHAVLGPDVQGVRVKHCDLDLIGSGVMRHGNYQAARSDEAVVKYCQKDGDFIWWGADPNVRQGLREGKRSFLMAGLVAGTTSLEDAVMQHPALLSHYKQLEQNLAAFRAAKKRRPQGVTPLFLYLMGPSGVGKTTVAKSLHPVEETFLVPLPQKAGDWWFDGYSGQRCLVFDNVSRATCPPYDLICRLVDASTCSVPVKGGHVSCSPDVIVVTSVLHPSELWQGNWDVQVKRRITHLLEAKTTLSSTLGENQVTALEMEHGVTRSDVTWTQVDLTPWRVTALPPGTTTLLERLRVEVTSSARMMRAETDEMMTDTRPPLSRSLVQWPLPTSTKSANLRSPATDVVDTSMTRLQSSETESIAEQVTQSVQAELLMTPFLGLGDDDVVNLDSFSV